jgi:hypothetical protein
MENEFWTPKAGLKMTTVILSMTCFLILQKRQFCLDNQRQGLKNDNKIPPPVKKKIILNVACFLIFQNRHFFLDTKSKSQYDAERALRKKKDRHIEQCLYF